MTARTRTAIRSSLASLALGAIIALALAIGAVHAAWPSARGVDAWTSTGGPPGAVIEWMALSPAFTTDHTILMGGWGNTYRSTDSGMSWTSYAPGGHRVFSVFYAPNQNPPRLMFATSLAGLLRSTDGGARWTVSVPATADAECVGFAPDFSTDGTVIAGTYSSGILLSTNGGASWTSTKLNGLGWPRYVSIVRIALSPTYASDHTVFAASDGGSVFRSTDGGRDWTALDLSAYGVSSLAVSPNYLSDHTVYVGSDVEFLRSTNSGVTWSRVGGGAPTSAGAGAILFSPSYLADRTTIMHCPGLGTYKSTDGGSSWKRTSTGPTNMVGAMAISPTYDDRGPDRTIFAGDDGGTGFHVSRDGGAHWLESSAGLAGTDVLDLTVSPDYGRDGRVVATVWFDDPDRLLLRNLEKTRADPAWKHVAAPFEVSVVFSPDFARDGTMFGDGGTGTIYRSTDRGATWRRTGTTPGGSATPWIYGFTVASDTGPVHTLFAAGPGTFRSDDLGAHWIRLDRGMNTVWCLAVSPNYARDKTLFCSDVSYMRKSTDGGRTWAASYAGLTGYDRRTDTLAISPTYARDHTVYARLTAGLARTTNGGRSWTKLPAQQLDSFNVELAVSPDHVHDRTLFAGTFEGIVYKSSNMGATWTKWADGYPSDMQVRSMALSPNVASGRGWLFAGTEEAGVWTRAVGDIARPLSTMRAPVYSSDISTTSAFRISWTATDTGSGVASYDVQYRTGRSILWRALETRTTKTRRLFSGTAGFTYRFRVRARDRVGNLSLWSAVKSTTVPLDQRAMDFAGAWVQRREPSLFGGSAMRSGTRGSNAYHRWYLKSMTLIITRRPSGGIVDVFVGSRLAKRIDCYAPTTRYRVPIKIFSFNGYRAVRTSARVIRRKNRSSSGYGVEIDGVAINR